MKILGELAGKKETITTNLDGLVVYYPDFLNESESKEVFDVFMQELEWNRERLLMYGKEILMKRKVALYGDKGLLYTYSGDSKQSLQWHPLLSEIRNHLKTKTNQEFNICLANLYHDGSEGMGWHADDEPELGPNPTVASVSLGASRDFQIRHNKTGETINISLEPGSLLIMSGPFQHNWKHQIPKRARVKSPRINLTFRRIISR